MWKKNIKPNVLGKRVDVEGVKFYIQCTISLAPPIFINHKMYEVNYFKILSSFAYAQHMHFGYLNLQNTPSKTTKFSRGSTNENHTFVIFLCHDVFNITPSNWHGVY